MQEAAEQRQIGIRRAKLDDLPSIQDFIAATYGTSAPFKGPERWHWQFVDTPFRPDGDQGPIVWIAPSENHVVEQIAVQDGALVIGDKTFPAGWIVDVMIHPDFRRYGLGHRLHDAILLDRDTLVTLTMAPATRRIAERAGCVTLGLTRQFILPSLLGMGTVQRYLACKAHNRPDLAWDVYTFAESGIGPATIATLARGVTFLRSDGRIRGCLVTRLGTQDKLPQGVIADMFALPNDHAAQDALIALASDVLGKEVEYLEAAASRPALQVSLRKAGFFATRTMRPTVVCRNPVLKALVDAAQNDWHFTKADHDWDQIHPA